MVLQSDDFAMHTGDGGVVCSFLVQRENPESRFLCPDCVCFHGKNTGALPGVGKLAYTRHQSG